MTKWLVKIKLNRRFKKVREEIYDCLNTLRYIKPYPHNDIYETIDGNTILLNKLKFTKYKKGYYIIGHINIGVVIKDDESESIPILYDYIYGINKQIDLDILEKHLIKLEAIAVKLIIFKDKIVADRNKEIEDAEDIKVNNINSNLRDLIE